MAAAFKGLTRFRRIVDNIVIYDKDIKSHVSHVRQFLQHYQDRQITFKMQQKTTFTGFELPSTGYYIDFSVIDVISKFPTPTYHTDLCSFLGLSTSKVAELLAPLRPILSVKIELLWTSDHDQAITKAKSHLMSTPHPHWH